VHGDTGGSFEFLSIDGGEDSDVVVGASRGGDQPVALVDHFYEVADYQGDCLDPLELFLGPELLSFELDLILLDVVLLDVEEVQIFVEFLQFVIQVFLLFSIRPGVSLAFDLHCARFKIFLNFNHIRSIINYFLDLRVAIVHSAFKLSHMLS
jgi:hypothetical protein